MMLLSSFLYVLFPLLTTFAVVWFFSIFERVKVELGLEHYAEKGDPSTFLKMPANASVNLGYVLVGLYWLWKINKLQKKLKDQAFFYYMFSWMSVFYGFVQFGRIVTQTRLFAVMDQWFTLPFFAWIVCWNEFVYRGYWKTGRYLSIMRISVFSYFAVLFHDQGFEAVLGLHILAALVYSLRTQWKPDLGTERSRHSFILALTSCVGFVCLKLADHHLAQYSMFQTYTGHFWSKVCDVAQIHFAADFFTNLCTRHKKDKT
ncbi:transmembrane protein 187-like [Oculina patagonica]